MEAMPKDTNLPDLASVPSHAATKTLLTVTVLLPKRDYVTFGSLLSQICLSSVCRL